jgi:hypothetical protein
MTTGRTKTKTVKIEVERKPVKLLNSVWSHHFFSVKLIEHLVHFTHFYGTLKMTLSQTTL